MRCHNPCAIEIIWQADLLPSSPHFTISRVLRYQPHVGIFAYTVKYVWVSERDGIMNQKHADVFDFQALHAVKNRIGWWRPKCAASGSLPSKSTCPSPFRSMSRRMSSKSLCPTWNSQFKGTVWMYVAQIRMDRQTDGWTDTQTDRLSWQLSTCCPSSFFMASLSSAVLIWPSPLVSNWGQK